MNLHDDLTVEHGGYHEWGVEPEPYGRHAPRFRAGDDDPPRSLWSMLGPLAVGGGLLALAVAVGAYVGMRSTQSNSYEHVTVPRPAPATTAETQPSTSVPDEPEPAEPDEPPEEDLTEEDDIPAEEPEEEPATAVARETAPESTTTTSTTTATTTTAPQNDWDGDWDGWDWDHDDCERDWPRRPRQPRWPDRYCD